MNNQNELFVEFPAAAVNPDHPDSEWKTFPGGLPYRRVDEKTTQIDFDGEIFNVVRRSGGRYSAPEILGDRRPCGFQNFMSRVLMVRDARREMARAAEARARADAAVERVFVADADTQPTKPRWRNKLATVRSQIAEKRYIDPFGEKQTGQFFYITPAWLVAARTEPEGPTWLEIAVYSRLTHPVTFKDTGFCKRFWKGSTAAVIDLDLHSLAGWLRADYKATRKAFASLVNRGLLEEVENDKERGPKTVRFLWHRWMKETGLKPVSSSEEKEALSPPVTGLKPVSPHVLKIKDNRQTIKEKTPNRPQAAGIEEEFLSRLCELCSPKEMEKNGVGWRTWAREDSRALRAAIDDLAVRNDNYHLGKVKNPAAYINKRYQFYSTKIARSDEAMTDLSPDKSLREFVRESISQAESERPA